jgi:hypothetical protein
MFWPLLDKGVTNLIRVDDKLVCKKSEEEHRSHVLAVLNYFRISAKATSESSKARRAHGEC